VVVWAVSQRPIIVRQNRVCVRASIYGER
jgi:hypothetical protein